MQEREVLELLSRLVSEPGSAELDVEVAKALGAVRGTAYCVKDGEDPETGHPGFSSPEYDAWSKYEREYFDKHDDLPSDDDYPETLLTGKPSFGNCSSYSRSVDSLMLHVPRELDFGLERKAGGKFVCTIGSHVTMMADSAACALAAAIILHRNQTGAIPND